MSECSEQTGVARLVGAAPGYVGYGEGGQLTDQVRRRPASVVVLDEIEKAHRDVQMLLLQVLEEARLTDGRGRQVDFSNAVVILTSNLGAAEATRASSGAMGFGAQERAAPRGERVLDAARGAVPPELWNRLDERVVFGSLSRDDVGRVARLLLDDSSRRLEAERRIRFVASRARSCTCSTTAAGIPRSGPGRCAARCSGSSRRRSRADPRGRVRRGRRGVGGRGRRRADVPPEERVARQPVRCRGGASTAPDPAPRKRFRFDRSFQAIPGCCAIRFSHEVRRPLEVPCPRRRRPGRRRVRRSPALTPPPRSRTGPSRRRTACSG